MNKLSNVIIVCLLGAVAYEAYDLHQKKLQMELTFRETHPLCKDTPTKTAWVAYKNGEPRCFLENNSYPHKITGSNINEESL